MHAGISRYLATLLGFSNDNNIKLQAIHQPHAQHPVTPTDHIFPICVKI
jgi:hypothetical protein